MTSNSFFYQRPGIVSKILPTGIKFYLATIHTINSYTSSSQ